jgi:hypothetical protein
MCEKQAQFSAERLKEKDSLKDADINGRKINLEQTASEI